MIHGSDGAGDSVVQRLGEQGICRRDLLKGAVLLGASTVFSPVIVACGGGQSGVSPSAAVSSSPKKGGNLRLGITGGSAQDTIDPQRSNNLTDNTRTSQIFQGLLSRDHDFKLVPSLAEEVIPNAAGDVWTARLRKGVVWHNGKPFTADDVLYTIALVFDPTYPNAAQPFFKDIDRKATRKLDDLTVEIRLKKPNGVFDGFLAENKMMIKPDGWSQKNELQFVGTGPFKLESFTPGDRSVAVAFPDFWGEGPYVDRVESIDFADPTAQVNALLGGVVDAIGTIPAAQVTQIKQSGFRVLDYETGAFSYMFWRCDMKPASDVRVRQAFRLIMDRQQMVDLALGGYGRPGNDMWGVFDAAYPKDLPQRAQDLEQAKSLLKQAGYDALTITDYTSNVGTGLVSLSQVFAQQAKAAGVTVNIEKIDPATYYGDKYLTWPNGPGQYSARTYLNQAQFMQLWNEPHFKDEKWTSLVAEAQTTVDQTKRNELVRACCEIDYTTGGYDIPILLNNVDASVSKLQGLIPDPAGPPFNGGAVNELWFA